MKIKDTYSLLLHTLTKTAGFVLDNSCAIIIRPQQSQTLYLRGDPEPGSRTSRGVSGVTPGACMLQHCLLQHCLF